MDARDRGIDCLQKLAVIECCYSVDKSGIIIIDKDIDREFFEDFIEEAYEALEKYIRGERWYDD